MISISCCARAWTHLEFTVSGVSNNDFSKRMRKMTIKQKKKDRKTYQANNEIVFSPSLFCSTLFLFLKIRINKRKCLLFFSLMENKLCTIRFGVLKKMMQNKSILLVLPKNCLNKVSWWPNTIFWDQND